MLKFKTDENLLVEASRLLREAGYDSMTVHEQNLTGHPDTSLSMHCSQEERALITFDLDFSDIRAYPPEDFFGLIVLRLRQQDRDHVIRVIEQLIPKLADQELVGKLWIVNEQSVRIRG